MTGTGYKRNPVPESNYAQIERAKEGYRQFTGHEPGYVDEYRLTWPKVAYKFGECLGVMYETTRDGKRERYLHKFSKGSRPALVSNFDGNAIHMIGGSYDFTERGIVDRKK